jgi:signal transduction histidine kinase
VVRTGIRGLRRREGAAPEDTAETPPPVGAAPPPVRRPLPHPGQLRRERRALLQARGERIQDLGGLMLEMYRRDQFRQDLLVERCDELAELEERLAELDALLATSQAVRRPPAVRCACGTPIFRGSHFCAHCGRATNDRPVVPCSACGAALAADSRFCPACGASLPGSEGLE